MMNALNIEEIGGIGDHIEADQERNQIRITCNSDWAGDTETGFGEHVSISLNKLQTEELRDWLNNALENWIIE